MDPSEGDASTPAALQDTKPGNASEGTGMCLSVVCVCACTCMWVCRCVCVYMYVRTAVCEQVCFVYVCM